MATDTSEKGLETLIVRHMTGTDGLPPMWHPWAPAMDAPPDVVARPQTALGGTGWLDDGVRDDPTQDILFSKYEDWRNVLWDSASYDLDLVDARYIFRHQAAGG